MVDSAVVGRYVGKQALASVGATMSVLNMVIFVIIGLTVGTCIITGQSFGAGNEEQVRDTAGAAIYISFGMCIVVCVADWLDSSLDCADDMLYLWKLDECKGVNHQFLCFLYF